MLSYNGLFGENSRKRLMIRDSLTTGDYLYECFTDVFSPDKYFNSNSISIMTIILEIIFASLKGNPENTITVLNAFTHGLPNNFEYEFLSSYKNYLSDKVKVCECNDCPERVAMNVIHSYSKGVELVGKFFTQLLTMKQIEKGINYSYEENYCLSIYEKIEQYRSLANSEGEILLADIIDRRLRNSDSHLNANYDIKELTYTFKLPYNKNGKQKINIVKINYFEMVMVIYPKIGWFLSGIIGAYTLFVLWYINDGNCKKALLYIKEIEDNSNHWLKT